MTIGFRTVRPWQAAMVKLVSPDRILYVVTDEADLQKLVSAKDRPECNGSQQISGSHADPREPARICQTFADFVCRLCHTAALRATA